MRRTVSALLYASLPLLATAGCELVGPADIRRGRPNYNDAIHDTSKQQVFLNVVRVANHEPPFFMDITEVDAQLQWVSSITGGASGIGSASTSTGKSSGGSSSAAAAAGGGSSGGGSSASGGATGNLSATLSYQESPTIRYQPLQGQPLIAQISSPLTPDSIQALIDSNWPVSTVLSLAVERLTPDISNYYAALDAIIRLDQLGALVISAEPSQYVMQAPLMPSVGTGAPGTGGPVPLGEKLSAFAAGGGGGASSAGGGGGGGASSGGGGGGGGSSPDNTLVLYYAPITGASDADKHAADRLWVTLKRIYSGPPNFGRDDNRIEIPAVFTFPSIASPTSDTTIRIIPKPAGSATTAPANDTPKGQQTIVESRVTRVERSMPILHTRSALGILHDLADDPTRPAVLIPADVFAKVLNTPIGKIPSQLDQARERHADYYRLPELKQNDLLNRRRSGAAQMKINALRANASDIGKRVHFWAQDTFEPAIQEDVPDEDISDTDRTFLVIVTSDGFPPADAFVSVFFKGKFYYIDARDEVSKKTFCLLSQFLTMQALPNQTAPLTPTIPVGGGH